MLLQASFTADSNVTTVTQATAWEDLPRPTRDQLGQLTFEVRACNWECPLVVPSQNDCSSWILLLWRLRHRRRELSGNSHANQGSCNPPL